MTRRIPIAWLQLSAERLRLMAAVAGIAFAAMLMLMQLGFRDALVSSATLVHEHLEGQIVLISPLYEYLISTRSFPEFRLQQALGAEGVASVAPIYVSVASWKNPDKGLDYKIQLLGVDVGTRAFTLPEIARNLDKTRTPDVVLADAIARPEFGPIAEWFRTRGVVVTEVNRHRVKVRGLFRLGTGFGVNGTIVTSDTNFLRLVPARKRAHDRHRARDAEARGRSRARCDARSWPALPADVRVLTRQEFVDARTGVLGCGTRPIGFIFNLGTFMGLIVGAVIVYQILYSDVSDHLRRVRDAQGHGLRRRIPVRDRHAGGAASWRCSDSCPGSRSPHALPSSPSGRRASRSR